MSRIGLKTIEIPEGVDVDVAEQSVSVKGPKVKIKIAYNDIMKDKIDSNTITVRRPNDQKKNRYLNNTSRSLIANMIDGVTKGFQKQLENVSVGYRAQKQVMKLVINAG